MNKNKIKNEKKPYDVYVLFNGGRNWINRHENKIEIKKFNLIQYKYYCIFT